MPESRLERTRRVYLEPAVAVMREQIQKWEFEDAVRCIRAAYGDKVADRWAKDNADSWV